MVLLTSHVQLITCPISASPFSVRTGTEIVFPGQELMFAEGMMGGWMAHWDRNLKKKLSAYIVSFFPLPLQFSPILPEIYFINLPGLIPIHINFGL